MDARGLRDQSPVLFLPSKRKIIMDSTERVAIFIDGSNFYHGLKANSDRFINLDQFPWEELKL